MSKAQAILLALAVAAIGVAASAASASARTGPEWHLNGAKLGGGESFQVTGENFSGTLVKLTSVINSRLSTIACSASIEGKVIGGNPGKGEENITYSGCSLEGLSSCVVTLEKTKADTELGYEVGGTELLVDVLYTTGGFTTVTIGGGSCALSLSPTEVRPAKEKYDVALIDTHPEHEESSGLFMALTPVIKEVDMAGKTEDVGLVLGGQTATLEADLLIKALTEELKFAAFKE